MAKHKATTRQQLQRLIDRTAKAQTVAFKVTNELLNFCEEHYGFTPGDVDSGEIIDAVLGGCGVSNGMKAERFDEIMRTEKDHGKS